MELSIVLAEDEADLRALYAETLRQAGYTVGDAEDGRVALVLIEQMRPALLILDLWMPVLSGFEVLEKLREDPRASDMKVVLLSNVSDADTRLEGFASGVQDYWVKDLSLSDLLANVRRVLSDNGVMPAVG